jgi:Tfp pilus assembly protein FimT
MSPLKRLKISGGFTLIEVVLIIGIVGVLMVASYPSIINTLETRTLENAARDVQMSLQQAKMQAVRERINHRIRFDNSQGFWLVWLERETGAGVWSNVTGTVPKRINDQYVVIANVPTRTVEFSPMGVVINYSSTQRTISLQSLKLRDRSAASLRVINIFAGGTFEYVKSF